MCMDNDILQKNCYAIYTKITKKLFPGNAA